MPESPMSRIPPVDPITLEIIRGSLASAIRDMELLMERCAMSPFIKEKKDYFVGIFDTRGRIVACHISGSGPGMLQPILEALPARDHAAGRRLLVQRPVHLGRRRAAPPGHGVHGAGLPRGAAGGLRHHVRPLPGHRRAAGRLDLAARHRDLPRGRARAARADRPRGAAQRGGVPDLPPQLAAARPGGGRHPRHDGLLPPGRDPAGRALRPLRRGHAAGRLRRVHRPDRGAGARAVPRAGAAGASGASTTSSTATAGPRRGPIASISRSTRAGDHVRLDGSNSDDQARGPINFTTNPGLLRIAFGRYLQSLDADLEVNEGLLAQPRRVDRPRGQHPQAALPGAARHARQHPLPGDVLHLRHAGPGQRRPRARRLAGLRPLLLPGLGRGPPAPDPLHRGARGGARGAAVRRRGRRHLLHRPGELPGGVRGARLPAPGGALRGAAGFGRAGRPPRRHRRGARRARAGRARRAGHADGEHGGRALRGGGRAARAGPGASRSTRARRRSGCCPRWATRSS